MLPLSCSKDNLAWFSVIRFFADIPHAWCTCYKLVTDIDKIRAEGNKIKWTENAMYALNGCFWMPTVNRKLRQLQVWDAVAVVQTLCQIKTHTHKKVLINMSNWPTIVWIFIAYRKIVKENAILCFNGHCQICDWTVVCHPVSYRYRCFCGSCSLIDFTENKETIV